MLQFVRRSWHNPLARRPGSRWTPRISIVTSLIVVGTASVGGMVCSLIISMGNSFSKMLLDAASLAMVMVIPSLIVGGVISGLQSWTHERSAGVLQDVALMPLDRGQLVWGRWLHTGLVFAAALLFMSPCYLLAGTGEHGSVINAHSDPLALLGFNLRSDSAGISAGGLLVSLVMLLKDISVITITLSVPFWLSARCQSRIRATVLAWVIVALVVFGLDPAIWRLLLGRWLVTMIKLPDYLFGSEVITGLVVKSIKMLFWLICWGGLVGRLLASYLAVRAVVVNFDRYALGERARR